MKLRIMRSKRVSHRRRCLAKGPLHAVVRLRPGLPSLRKRQAYRALEGAFRAAKDRFGCRILHFAVMSNHVHLVLEAEHRESAMRAMHGLTIRMAKALNKAWARKGKVFDDRFFARSILSFDALRKTLIYVFNNARKHRLRIKEDKLDPFTSARWFPFWKERAAKLAHDPPVAEFGRWVANMWEHIGTISIYDRPADPRFYRY